MRIKEQITDAIKEHEKNVEESELRKRIEELLANVGLASEVAGMYRRELSGGMRQRAITAMATALSPELIIADELTTALDVVDQRGPVQLFLKTRRESGCSIILITRDMAVHAQMVDRLATMDTGKIVEIGKANHVFGNPLHATLGSRVLSTHKHIRRQEMDIFSR